MTAIDHSGEEWLGPATAGDETPVYLLAGEERLFGILTRPVGSPNGTAVLCLHDAQNLTSYRNRVYTRLCRDASGAGYQALRMDFHGTGDSSGILTDRGISGQTMLDVDAAVRYLIAQGSERIVVLGPCWGSLVALAAAARHDEIVSACLIAPPLHLLETGASATVVRSRHEKLAGALSHALRPHVIRLLFTEPQYRKWVLGRIRRRVSDGLRARFGGRRGMRPVDDGASVSAQSLIAPLVKRRVPIHALYGEQDPLYLDLLKHSPVRALEGAEAILDLRVTPVTVHGLGTLEAQDTVLRYVRECLLADAEGRSGADDARLLLND